VKTLYGGGSGDTNGYERRATSRGGTESVAIEVTALELDHRLLAPFIPLPTNLDHAGGLQKFATKPFRLSPRAA
jgi:hypothetical protein